MSSERYTPVEQFSLERYLGEWSRHRDSVVVEGMLQEDGDFYIIDRDPSCPSELLKVRKADVIDYSASKTIHVTGDARQLYRIAIKRGVPVVRHYLCRSDDLDHLAYTRNTTISVTFVNSTLFHHVWTIKDAENDTILFNANLNSRDEEGNSVTLNLSAPNGRFGQAKYKHDGTSIFTATSLLEDGQTYEMN